VRNYALLRRGAVVYLRSLVLTDVQLVKAIRFGDPLVNMANQFFLYLPPGEPSRIDPVTDKVLFTEEQWVAKQARKAYLNQPILDRVRAVHGELTPSAETAVRSMGELTVGGVLAIGRTRIGAMHGVGATTVNLVAEAIADNPQKLGWLDSPTAADAAMFYDDLSEITAAVIPRGQETMRSRGSLSELLVVAGKTATAAMNDPYMTEYGMISYDRETRRVFDEAELYAIDFEDAHGRLKYHPLSSNDPNEVIVC